MLRGEDGDAVGVVAALLDEAGLAPPPGERTGEVEAAHLPGVPLLALSVLRARARVEAVVVGGVSAPRVDTPQVCGALPVVIALDCLATTNFMSVTIVICFCSFRKEIVNIQVYKH